MKLLVPQQYFWSLSTDDLVGKKKAAIKLLNQADEFGLATNGFIPAA